MVENKTVPPGGGAAEKLKRSQYLRAASQSSPSSGAFNAKNDNRVSGTFRGCIAGSAGAHVRLRRSARKSHQRQDFRFDEPRSRTAGLRRFERSGLRRMQKLHVLTCVNSDRPH
jgi:hypothetical protein